MPVAKISPEVHKRILGEIRAHREALQRELAELEAVERFHAARAGSKAVFVTNAIASENGSDAAAAPMSAGSHDLEAMTRHDQAAFALREIGKPAKVGEICDFLAARGCGRNQRRRIFFNGIFTAVKRRDDMFERVGDSQWKLKDPAPGSAGGGE